MDVIVDRCELVGWPALLAWGRSSSWSFICGREACEEGLRWCAELDGCRVSHTHGRVVGLAPACILRQARGGFIICLCGSILHAAGAAYLLWAMQGVVVSGRRYLTLAVLINQVCFGEREAHNMLE